MVIAQAKPTVSAACQFGEFVNRVCNIGRMPGCCILHLFLEFGDETWQPGAGFNGAQNLLNIWPTSKICRRLLLIYTGCAWHANSATVNFQICIKLQACHRCGWPCEAVADLADLLQLSQILRAIESRPRGALGLHLVTKTDNPSPDCLLSQFVNYEMIRVIARVLRTRPSLPALEAASLPAFSLFLPHCD